MITYTLYYNFANVWWKFLDRAISGASEVGGVKEGENAFPYPKFQILQKT